MICAAFFTLRSTGIVPVLWELDFDVFYGNLHADLGLQVDDDDGRTTTDGRDGRTEDDDDGTDDGFIIYLLYIIYIHPLG